MKILALLSAVFLLSIYLSVTASFSQDLRHFGGGLVALCSGVVLFFALISLPLNPMFVEAKIEKYKSVQKTAERARQNTERWIERASYQQTVAKMNQWRAQIQYWNDTAFDIWIPDTVDTLEPIE